MISPKRIYILLISVASACLPLVAQDTLSLQDALRIATGRNGQVQKAQVDINIMRDRSRMEQSIIYPQLTGSYSLDYFPLLPTSLVPGEFVNEPGTFIPIQFGQPWQTSGQLTVTQLLYNEAYRRAIPARKLSIALSETLLAKSKEEVAWQVAQLYLQIQQTEELKTTLATHESRLVAIEKSVIASVQNGFAIKTDLSKVQLAQQQLQAQKQQLLDALFYQKELLCFLLDNSIDTSLSLSTKEPLGISLVGPTNSKSSDVRAVEQGIELQDLQIRSVQAERYPDVRAYASGLVQSQRRNANFFEQDNRWFGMGVVGLKAHFPIYDGGRLKQRITQLGLEKRKTELDLKRLMDAQSIEVRNAGRGVASSKELVTLAERSVELAKDVLDATQRQYREGTQPLKELLDAQSALAEADSQLATKRIAVLLAEVKYLKVAGRIAELW